eukprot:scaffold118642_cov52-Cyclotella_meneghiniana.AAC.2
MYVSSQGQIVIQWITSSGTQFGRESLGEGYPGRQQEEDENGILGCQGGVSLRRKQSTRIRPPIKPNHPRPSTEIPSDRFQFNLIRFLAPPKLLPARG